MNIDKLLKSTKLFILIIGIIYATLTVLACISAINDITNVSTTSANFGTVLSLVWFQICIIAFLGFTYYMYSKKRNVAVIFEIIIAIALILNVIANIIIVKAANSLVFLNFIIPAALLLHSIWYVYGIYLQKVQEKTKEMFKS